MAYTTINKSSSFINTNLWTGNTSGQTISGVGFQPDFNWSKCRSNTYAYQLIDSVRGITKQLNSNDNQPEGTNANGITAFNADGYSIGTQPEFSNSGNTFVGWSWKAGTAVSGQTTGSGTYKTYTGSVNTTSGFSIIKYTGNGTAGHTIPHHLGVAPKMIIVKSIAAVQSWIVLPPTSDGYNKDMKLEDTSPLGNSDVWNNTAPTSTVFSVGSNTNMNDNNAAFIAYCFAEKTGYSKFGSYTGNGNADGTFVYTGMKPAFVMMKCSSHAVNWGIYDNKRVGYNEVKNVLFPNLNDAENTDLAPIDLLSNGFKMRRNDSANDQNNKGGATYIYMAFGQSLVGTNNIPANAF